MATDFRKVREDLRQAYDSAADQRDRKVKDPWKLAERAAFLHRLQQANCTRMLEIGAGTGQDSAFFASHGEQIVRFASESFEVVDFHIAEEGTRHRFQSLTLRRPLGSGRPA